MARKTQKTKKGKTRSLGQLMQEMLRELERRDAEEKQETLAVRR